MSTSPSWNPIWETIFRENEWGKYPSEHVIRFVARRFYRVPDRSQIKLLDVGCGPGAQVWFMAREGFSVSGIDGSETAVKCARDRLSREGLSADLRVGDLVQLPWPDNYFDAVVENAALCCNRFENCRHIVAEIRRVLKPGGHFISTNPTNRLWGYGSGEQVGPNEFATLSEGPFANRGFNVLMDRAQVDALYAPMGEYSVETLTWTAGGMRHLVESWIVEGRKSLS